MNKIMFIDPDIIGLVGKNGNIQTRRDATFAYSVLRSDGIAIIAINDELVEKSSWFGGLDYLTISSTVESLEGDESVKEIVLDFTSPGGDLCGLFEATKVIRNCSKPIYAFTSTYMCSAAYALASATKAIIATKEARIGSIGAYMTFIDTEKYDEKMGVKRIDFYGRNSEMKNLDPLSEEGKKVYQTEIDKAEELFISAIAENRKTTFDNVVKTYGHGLVFFADEALNRGMIDGVEDSYESFIENLKKGAEKMDEKTVAKAKENEAEAIAKATADAIKAERERVKEISQYLEMPNGVGKIAREAIEKGDSIEKFKLSCADMFLKSCVNNTREALNLIKEEAKNDLLVGAVGSASEQTCTKTVEERGRALIESLNQKGR